MKKFFGLAILFLILFCQTIYSFAKINEAEYIQKGNEILKTVESGQNPELNSMYLKKAQYYFYVASRKTPPSSDALTGLGRVYTLQGKYDDAKNTLFRAFSLDPYNSSTSFYFAEFCYKNDDYITALEYYEKAQKLGFTDRVKTQEMINKCNSKLGIGIPAEE